MSDIDWPSVDYVVTIGPLHGLRVPEKKMAVRRFAEKMNRTPSIYAAGLTTGEVAHRLGITERSVERTLAQLPPGVKNNCPKCGEFMWVVDGIVEAHPGRLLDKGDCEMSNKQMFRGLAAIRPDLYRWLEAAS
jgi:hypothetical protein